MAQPVRCFACGGMFPAADGPTHRYLESSAGCWAAYGEVLAREYSSLEYGRLHRLTVDTYSVQHPGRPSPQTVQSAALHLVSLCLVLERGASSQEATRAIRIGATRKGCYTWLTPPSSTGSVTVADVLSAPAPDAHLAWVQKWAQDAWLAWQPHHDTVRTWVNELAPARPHEKFLSRQ